VGDGDDPARLDQAQVGRIFREESGRSVATLIGVFDTGAEGGIPGGIYAPGDPVGDYVSFYAAVQGLEAYLERAERLGGKVVQQPTPISETARVAMFLDPEGHRIGLLEQS
jgi:predicted enzyme related to lactoylglutathione lyase